MLALTAPQPALAARNFPTDAELENIVKTCAAGYSTSIQGEVSGALKNDDAKVAMLKIY